MRGDRDLAGVAETAMPLTPYVADQIWLCPYSVRMAGTRFEARMTVIRLASGKLILHSPCEITAAMAEEIAALGPVAHILVPEISLPVRSHSASRVPKREDLDLPRRRAQAPWPEIRRRPRRRGAPGLG